MGQRRGPRGTERCSLAGNHPRLHLDSPLSVTSWESQTGDRAPRYTTEAGPCPSRDFLLLPGALVAANTHICILRGALRSHCEAQRLLGGLGQSKGSDYPLSKEGPDTAPRPRPQIPSSTHIRAVSLCFQTFLCYFSSQTPLAHGIFVL